MVMAGSIIRETGMALGTPTETIIMSLILYNTQALLSSPPIFICPMSLCIENNLINIWIYCLEMINFVDTFIVELNIVWKLNCSNCVTKKGEMTKHAYEFEKRYIQLKNDSTDITL